MCAWARSSECLALSSSCFTKQKLQLRSPEYWLSVKVSTTSLNRIITSISHLSSSLFCILDDWFIHQSSIMQSSPESSSSQRKKRRRRRRGHQPTIHDVDDNDTELLTMTSSDAAMAGTSLTDLKRQILGRDLETNTYNHCKEQRSEEEDPELCEIRAMMNPSSSSPMSKAHVPSTSSQNNNKTSSVIATQLTSDLTCSICHDICYPPVSIPCGHSFCQECLQWWLDHSSSLASCPTCRQKVDNIDCRPNLALKAVVMTLYGPSLIKRIQACLLYTSPSPRD